MGNRGPDDQQSDSSGETIPSDSGRGGSEEDVSHAGHLGMAMNGKRESVCLKKINKYVLDLNIKENI